MTLSKDCESVHMIENSVPNGQSSAYDWCFWKVLLAGLNILITTCGVHFQCSDRAPFSPQAGDIITHNHDWQKSCDQERRHVRGHAAGRGGLCHPGHGEVQHRERHRSLHQEGETDWQHGCNLGMLTSLAHDVQIQSLFYSWIYFWLHGETRLLWSGP